MLVLLGNGDGQPEDGEDLAHGRVERNDVLDDVRGNLPGIKLRVTLGVFDMILDFVVSMLHAEHPLDQRDVIDHDIDRLKAVLQELGELLDALGVGDDDTVLVILQGT